MSTLSVNRQTTRRQTEGQVARPISANPSTKSRSRFAFFATVVRGPPFLAEPSGCAEHPPRLATTYRDLAILHMQSALLTSAARLPASLSRRLLPSRYLWKIRL